MKTWVLKKEDVFQNYLAEFGSWWDASCEGEISRILPGQLHGRDILQKSYTVYKLKGDLEKG